MSNGNEIEFEVVLEPRHVATGSTVHKRDGVILPQPRVLQIVQIAGEDGRYLLYLDEHGNEMTDTLHRDVSDAMEQARREFGVLTSEWQENT